MSKKSNSSDSDSDDGDKEAAKSFRTLIPELFRTLTINTGMESSRGFQAPDAPTSKGHKAQNRLFYRALEPKSKLPRASSEDESEAFCGSAKRCKSEIPEAPQLKPLVSDGSQIPFLDLRDLRDLSSLDCSEINAGAASCASVPQIGCGLPFIGASASDP